MKIASSALHLQAQHSATRVQSQSSRMELWVGQRPTSARPPQASVRISDAARQAAAEPLASAQRARTTARTDATENLTPHLAMVRDLIERMTGVVAQITTLPSEPALAAAEFAPASPSPAPQAARSAGFGLVVEQHTVLEESEHTQFAAEGIVRTADGQEVRFTLQLDMQRSYREETWSSLRLGDAAVPVDPLVINFDGTAAELQDLRFAFDLDGDSQTENVPLLAGNRGYLALDRNQNQRIDNGLELYGPATGNGYAELASHDDDGNGWIDENDAVYSQLRVWTPAAEGAGNLRTLQEAGVGALALATAATPFGLRTADNRTLGAVQATSIYLRDDGSAGSTQQIDLAV